MSGGGGGNGNGGGGGPPGGGDPGMSYSAPTGRQDREGAASSQTYSAPDRGGPPGGGDPGMTYTAPTPTADRHPDPSPVVTTAEAPPSILSQPEGPDRIQRISTGEEPGYRAQDSQPFGLSKEEAYRQGKITVDQRDADPVLTAPEERDLTRDLTFAEHWNLAPDALKFSPTLRLLWATGANLGEWSKRQGANVWDWGTGESNISPAPDRGDGQGATGTVSAAQSNFITSGQITPSNSVAANWYQSLGSSSASGNASAFNLASEYAAAKTKVKQTLGTPSAVGMLAVNDSPFFDFLQKHNLTKGIL